MLFGGVKLKTERFLRKYANDPWVRGKHDCIMFVWKYTKEVFGNPFADPLKYPFDDLTSAKRAFVKLCRDNGVKSVEELFDEKYHRTELPFGGCIVAKTDSEGLTGYSYGICYSGFGHFVDRRGLIALELNPLTDLYWSVD